MADNFYYEEIAEELKNCLNLVSKDELKAAVKIIAKSKKIFCAAAGRSALSLKGFAMRMMHLGKEIYFIGDITTPAIKKGDLLFVCSGSGNTESLVTNAIKASKLGAKIVLFTIDGKSKIARLSDCKVIIPAPSPKVKSHNDFQSIQPMGSLFEQSLFIILDSIIMTIMEKENIKETEMFSRHANLE